MTGTDYADGWYSQIIKSIFRWHVCVEKISRMNPASAADVIVRLTALEAG